MFTWFHHKQSLLRKYNVLQNIPWRAVHFRKIVKFKKFLNERRLIFLLSFYSIEIDKVTPDGEEFFKINLAITICYNNACPTISVLRNAAVPIPLCNLDATFELPGGGSFAAFAQYLAGNVGDFAIQAGLRKLGIKVVFFTVPIQGVHIKSIPK